LPLPDKPSLVVLPFVNMSGDPEQEYFSDGITEDLTSSLSRLSSLFVISRNTAFFYKGKAVRMPELSKELGVQYVLQGSVRKEGGQVRITTQLIDATQDRHLWAERYDRPLKDIFALQDEIVQKMVTTLKLQLSAWEQGILVKKTTDNLEAYDAFLRGLESWFRAYHERNKDANVQARQMFERAVELDPHYAEAYAQLGAAYVLDWFYSWNHTPQALERAGELARQAMTLDGSLPMPHFVLGTVYLWQKQHDLAIAEAERTITLDPNGAEGYSILGGLLAWAGRPEEGVIMAERAMRQNPRHPIQYLLNLGFTYRIAGRYEDAIATAKRILARQPNFPPAYFLLAYSYAQLDRLEEARAAGAEFQRLIPGASLEQWKRNAAFKDPALLERDLAAMRKAGWKEK
jgi:TolB-like protein/Tfp pilus assembly protein PilF